MGIIGTKRPPDFVLQNPADVLADEEAPLPVRLLAGGQVRSKSLLTNWTSQDILVISIIFDVR